MNSKPIILRLSALLTAGIAAALPAYGQDGACGEVTGRFDLAYVSKYVWRGIPQTASWALQPSVTAAHGSGLSFNYWASRDGDKGDFTENDYTLNYSRQAAGAVLNAGIIHYAFPNTSAPATSELYAGVTGGGALSPSLTVNWDFDEADGIYAALGVSGRLPGPSGTGDLQFTGRLGFSTGSYNGYWFGVRSAAISDVYIGVSAGYQFGRIAVTPSLGYCSVVSNKLRNSPNMQGLKRDSFVLGITAGMDL